MTGGILQLVMKGKETEHMINIPEVTLFKTIYRRHTNFSKGEHLLNFDKSGGNFGEKVHCRIKRFGDLLSKLFIVFDIPQINLVYDTVNVQFIKSLLLEYDIVYTTDNDNLTVVTETMLNDDIVPLIQDKITTLDTNITNYELYNETIGETNTTGISGVEFKNAVLTILLDEHIYKPQFTFLLAYLEDKSIEQAYNLDQIFYRYCVNLTRFVISRIHGYTMNLNNYVTTRPESSTTLILATADEETTESYYKYWYVAVGSQILKIQDSSDDTITVYGSWKYLPNVDSEYKLYNTPITVQYDNITFTHPSANTIVFDSGAEITTTDDALNNWYLKFGEQVVKITDYVGSTKTATIDIDLFVEPVLGVSDTCDVFRYMFDNLHDGTIVSSEQDEENNVTNITLDSTFTDLFQFYNGWYIDIDNVEYEVVDYLTERVAVIDGLHTFSDGQFCYIRNRSMEMNLEYCAVIDHSSYSVPTNLIGQSVQMLFDKNIQTNLENYTQYSGTDADIVKNEFFADSTSVLSQTTLASGTKTSLINHIKWNITHNIKLVREILRILGENVISEHSPITPDETNIHFRFGIYQKYTYTSGVYVQGSYVNLGNSSYTGLDDYFSKWFIVANDPLEPENITKYYNDYASSQVSTLHSNNLETVRRQKFNEYFTDTNFFSSVRISEYEDIDAIYTTKFLNTFSLNYVPLIILEDIRNCVNDYIGYYWNQKHPTQNLNSLFLPWLTDVGGQLGVLSATLNAQIQDYVLMGTDFNYVLSMINHSNKVANDIMLLMLSRTEALFTLTKYGDTEPSKLSVMDYIIEYYVKTIMEGIDTQSVAGGYLNDPDGDVDPNRLVLTDEQIIELKDIGDVIVRSYATSYENIPTFSNYKSGGYSIACRQLGLPIRDTTYRYNDALSSIWYNINYGFASNINTLFTNVISSGYLHDSVGLEILTDIQHINNYYTTEDTIVGDASTNYFHITLPNYNKIKTFLNNRLGSIDTMMIYYEAMKNMLKIKQTVPSKLKYYFESFQNIYDNAIKGVMDSQTNVYGTDFETSPGYRTFTTDEVNEIIYNELHNNIYGIEDIKTNIVNEFTTSVDSGTNPYDVDDYPELYDWYENVVGHIADKPAEITRMEDLNIELTNKKMYLDLRNIATNYSTLSNNLHISQYMMDYIVKNKTTFKGLLDIVEATGEATQTNFTQYFTDQIASDNAKLTKIGRVEGSNSGSDLEVLVTSIIMRSSPNFSWVDYLGYFLIEYVSIYIGDQLFDRHTGEWLYWQQMLDPSSHDKQGAIDKMVANGLSINQYNPLEKEEKRLYVPLSFWFCRNIPSAIPLVALLYNDVTIELKIKNIEDVLNVEGPLKGTVSGGGLQNIVKFTKKPKLTSYLLTEYIYLEHEERLNITKTKHEQLIEHIQHKDIIFGYSDVNEDNEIEVDIETNNMVKELFWCLRPMTNVSTTSSKNYTKYTYQYGEETTSTVRTVFNDAHEGAHDLWTLQTTTSTSPLNLIPMKSCRILFNGLSREAEHEGIFYNHYQPYERHESSLPEGVYNYSFSFHPNNFQPSGQVNAGTLEKLTLRIKLDERLVADMLAEGIKIKCTYYCCCYNIIRYLSGMAGFAFT